MSKIFLATLGGTIDSAPYSEAQGEYPKNATPMNCLMVPDAVTTIFNKLGLTHPLEHRFICNRDSKLVFNQERRKLMNVIDQAADEGADRLIVTIGTDRMCKTARFVDSHLERRDISVIFTGSLLPLTNGPHSDGWSNLERALTHPVEPGIVYIGMSDIFEDCRWVRKDLPNRRFYVINQPEPHAPPVLEPA
jgi:L-asparaginase/Glu-tRNA(Gln) amidotransferase subunit D